MSTHTEPELSEMTAPSPAECIDNDPKEVADENAAMQDDACFEATAEDAMSSQIENDIVEQEEDIDESFEQESDEEILPGGSFANLTHTAKALWIAVIAASCVLLILLITLLVILCVPHKEQTPSTPAETPISSTSATEKSTTTSFSTTAPTTSPTAGGVATIPGGNTVKVRNGHYICPVCSYVSPVGEACESCAMGGELSRHPCPTCGGKLFVSDVRPWLYCGYCDDFCVSSAGNYHSCHQCGRNRLFPSDFDPRNYVFGDGVCKQCQSGKKATTSAFYCIECGKRAPNVYPAGGQSYNQPGICNKCVEYCEQCGRMSNRIGSVNGICYDCYDAMYCSDCGKKLSGNRCPVCDATTAAPKTTTAAPRTTTAPRPTSPPTTAAEKYYCSTCGRECAYSELQGDYCTNCYMADTGCPSCGGELNSSGLCDVCDTESYSE